MQKRGQAAIEFLTTYGWAILLLIIAVGAIVGLGVFDPKTPNICNADVPFICQEVVFREGGFEATITTNDISSANVVANEVLINDVPCTSVRVKGKSVGDLSLSNGVNKIICYNDINLIEEKDKVKASLNLIYRATESSASHKVTASMNGRVEKSSYLDNFDSSVVLNMNFENSNGNTVLDDSSYGNNGVLYSGITACSGDGAEVVINGGMEASTGGLANSWSASSIPPPGSYVTSDAEPSNIISGARTQKIVATNLGHSRFSQGFNGHNSNGKYHLKATYKATQGGVKRILGVYNIVGGGQGLLFNHDLIEDNNWHTVDLYFTVPSDSTGDGYIDMPRIDSLSGTTTVYIDEVSIKEAFCPNLIADQYGNALSLDGIDDYMRISDNSIMNFDNNADFTLEAWIKTNDNAAGKRILQKRGLSSVFDLYMSDAGNGRVSLYIATTSSIKLYSEIISSSISDNQWHHIVAVVSNTDGNVRGYRDGVLQLTVPLITAGNPQNSENVIVGGYSSGALSFNGNIDNIRIYNRALSAGEVAQHYQNS